MGVVGLGDARVLDQERRVNWWIGKLSDAELASYSGMTLRNIQFVLNMDHIKPRILGGGRGSKGSRRVPAPVRNAIMIMQILNEAGLSFDIASKILYYYWFIVSDINLSIDFSPAGDGVCSVYNLFPNRGYAAQDILWQSVAYGHEYDPLGSFLPNNEALIAFSIDSFIHIINGKWVFYSNSIPSGFEILNNLTINGIKKENLPVDRDYNFLGEIDDQNKNFSASWISKETALSEKKANYERENFRSKIDLNLSLSIRQMKRRAYGLVAQ